MLDNGRYHLDSSKSVSYTHLDVYKRQQITHAAKEGGGDPNMNPSLRMYMDKAKEVGFPANNIEKAIQKGTGEGSEAVIYDNSSYEGFGPSNIQIIVDTLTDNKNRTVAELRRLFEDIGCLLYTSRCV